MVLKASGVKTVPNLLHLFDIGWPINSPQRSLTPLSQSVYSGDKPAEKQQWDHLKQCYILITELSKEGAGGQPISKQQAAEVVEVWRSGRPAAYALPDGSVAAKTSEAQPDGSVCFVNLLSNATSGKELTLNQVCQEARNLPIVSNTKNGKRAAAGRTGGVACGQAKRQRKAPPPGGVTS